MVEPPPVAASVQELIGREVEAIEAELVRIDGKLRALAWSAGVPRLRPAERWDEIALGVADDGQANGDQVAREALLGKRARLR